MTAYAAYFGAGRDVAIAILNSNTTEESLNIIEKFGIDISEFSKFVARRIVDRCTWYVGGKLDVKVKIYSLRRGFLAAADYQRGN